MKLSNSLANRITPARSAFSVVIQVGSTHLSHMITKIKTQNVDSINPLNYEFPGREGLKPSKKSVAGFIYVFAQHMCIISVIS